jgi:hypothetical protein
MLRSRSLVMFAGAAALAGCLSPDPDPATGQIGLSLVGQAENGTAFRLRNAAITVAGPAGTLTFSTEDDPDRTAIVERLATGAYSVGLDGSWRLEQLAADGAATPVTASLLSPNPQAFTIAADAVTRVALRFGVPGGEVELGEGDLELGVDVDVLPEPQLQAVVTDTAVVGLVEGDHHVVAVRLAAAPAADVVVTATADDAAVTVAPASIVFTATTWNQPQFVQLAAPHDVDVGDASTTVRLTAAAATPATVAVTVLDDDVLAAVVPSVPLQLDEGESETIQVRLDHRPLGDTTVTITSSAPAILTATPAALTFTADNWQTSQPVALHALSDADFDDADVVVEVAVAGAVESFELHVSDTTEIALGWPVAPAEVTALPSGTLTFYPVMVTRAMDIDRLQIAAGGSASIFMGVYSNQVDRPASLLYATPPRPVPVVLEPLSVHAIPQSGNGILGPGTYWLAIASTSTFNVATSPTSAPTVLRCQRTFQGGSLPSTVPSSPATTCSLERSIAIAAFGRP